MAQLEYTYLVEITDRTGAAWSGINRLSDRDLIFAGQPYSGLMNKPTQRIIKSADSSARAPAGVVVSNVVLPGNTRFTDAFAADPIAGKIVTIREVERPITALSVARLVYQGVVLYTQYDELSCKLVCVEQSLSSSKRIDFVVNTETFPRAKKEDVSSSVPVPFGETVPDAKLPIIELNDKSKTIDAIDETTLSMVLDGLRDLQTGAAFVGEEEVTITVIDVPTKTITVTRTVPTEHPKGSFVYMKLRFSIGVDASSYLNATTIENIRHVESDQQFTLPAPDGYTLIGPVRAAFWDKTPLVKKTLEGKQNLGIEFDTVDALNNAAGAFNAAGRNPAYTEKSFADVAGIGALDLRLSNSRHIRPLGNIIKVILQVVHSGNVAGSSLGPATFFVKSNSMISFQNIAPLIGTDLLDKDFMELGENKGRRAIEVPSAPVTMTQTLFPDTFATTAGGTGNPDPANPIGNVQDNNLGTTSRISVLFPGPGIGSMTWGFSAVPAGLNPADQLTGVRFKFRHGGNQTGTPENGGHTGTIELFRAGISVAGPGVFNSNPTNQVDEVATFVPAETVAALPLYTGVIVLNFPFTGDWQATEGYFEIDTIPVTGAADAGAVINQYDISSALPSLDWSEFKDFIVAIQGDGINQYKVFQTGINVIYEPEELLLPDNVYCDVKPALKGSVYNVFLQLWTAAEFGANSLASFFPTAPAEVAVIEAFHTANNYDADSVSGLIRSEELIALLQILARETRLFIYMVNGVLIIEEQDDIANLPAASLTLDQFDTVGKASFSGADIEEQVINSITAMYDLTDLEGERATIERESAASILVYGVQQRKLSYQFLRTLAAMQSTIAGIFDRNDTAFEQVSFAVTLLDRNNIAVMSRIALSLNWTSVQLLELQELAEGMGDHTIEVTARVLIK